MKTGSRHCFANLPLTADSNLLTPPTRDSSTLVATPIPAVIPPDKPRLELPCLLNEERSIEKNDNRHRKRIQLNPCRDWILQVSGADF